MHLNEIAEESTKLYAIQILMSGHLGAQRDGLATFYYRRNPRVPLEMATHTQDFCAIKASPTFFKDRDLVVERAKQVQKVCNRIRNALVEDGIHRDFFVKPVVWKERGPNPYIPK